MGTSWEHLGNILGTYGKQLKKNEKEVDSDGR